MFNSQSMMCTQRERERETVVQKVHEDRGAKSKQAPGGRGAERRRGGTCDPHPHRQQLLPGLVRRRPLPLALAMGNKASLMLQEEEIQVIQEETGCEYCVSCFRAER